MYRFFTTYDFKQRRKFVKHMNMTLFTNKYLSNQKIPYCHVAEDHVKVAIGHPDFAKKLTAFISAYNDKLL